MGNDDGDSDEQPVHRVTLDSFWIDRIEVNNEQYKICVDAGACQAPTTCDWGEPTFEDASKADHPAVCVDWNGAQAYCEWAGARLPTEAEWEYAARGPEGNIYPWGDEFDGARLNFCDANCTLDWRETNYDDGYERTASAGSFENGASWCQALDMAGNVWEWVRDWYDAYSADAQTSPTGAGTGDYRVLRGGAWDTNPFDARSAHRSRDNPHYQGTSNGFRCTSTIRLP